MIFDHYFPSFEDNENRGGLFVCEDVDPREAGELISECKNVLTISERLRLDFATEVAKDAKEACWSGVNDIVEWLACLFAEYAFRAISGEIFDADEAKTICRCVCETFMHK